MLGRAPFRRDGEAIVPRSCLALVREQAGSSAEHLALRPGVEPDRAYYVVTASGISPKAVASLRPLESESEGPRKPKLELTPPPPPEVTS